MEQQLALDRLRRRLRKGITFTSEEYPQEFLQSLVGTPPEDHPIRYKLPPDPKNIQLQKANEEMLLRMIRPWSEEDILLVSPTFRKEVSSSKVEREVNHCMNWVSQKVGRELRWCSTIEQQKRGVCHPHIIVMADGLGAMSRKKLKRRVKQQFGSDQVRVLPVRKKEGLINYICKKIPNAELNFGGHW